MHRPVAHVLAAVLLPEQARPQLPQWPVSVLRLDSHPLSADGAAGKLQFPQPAVQFDVQTPNEHARVSVLVEAQLRAHEPQLLTSALRLDSHPSSVAPGAGLQSPRPATHVGRQIPSWQLRTETFEVSQRWPQDPQCATSELIETSQPSSVTAGRGPLQLPRSGEQIGVQSPFVQEVD